MSPLGSCPQLHATDDAANGSSSGNYQLVAAVLVDHHLPKLIEQISQPRSF
jgi:hypothetical protein